MMDKEKKYSISNVSKLTGYETHVLRYYENNFNIEVPRTKSNRRYYTDKEIEIFRYIKKLQEKSLTNKQIKDILNSPEVMLSETNELVATTSEENVISDIISVGGEEDIYTNISNMMNSGINSKLEEVKNEIIDSFNNTIKNQQLLIEDHELRKDKDVFISENARLKMKIKEKAYEIAELKDKIKRLDCTKEPFWKRFFQK
ncbi:MerR family transcriptional regulator [Lutibacter sp. B2]|nr:MerR family transcriptional regulator [Lutibacter sp. B2]